MAKPLRRADSLLVDRGLFDSRAKAQEAIAAGRVASEGAVVRKASERIAIDAQVVAAPAYEWVSRGGLKLAAALDAFGLDPSGRVCLDIGASTGGFTHVLLARGARRIYAVDVGFGQLHPKLRCDPRIISYEKTDARHLGADAFAEPPSFLVCDVSFISLRLVLPHVLPLARPNAILVALIKPQFEAGPDRVRKGRVANPEIRAQVCRETTAFIEDFGWRVTGTMLSPILGGSGNVEFLAAARNDAP